MSFQGIKKSDITPQNLVVYIEGDTKDKPWYIALDWQRKEFMKALQWGTMKSMGAPNDVEISKEFEKNGFKYKFVIFNDWNPCFMINLTTKKIREVKYLEMKKERFNNIKLSGSRLLSEVFGITKEQIWDFNKNIEKF